MNEPVRVLIAEDNGVDRLLLSALVRREGYEVEEAVDGHDALARFRERRPHMVLLDALMPGLDGFEVARRIKAEAGEAFLPIIFLTSLSEPDALAQAVAAGGDDFLSKPYNQVILKAKLNALSRMRGMHATMHRQRDEIARHHAHLLQEQAAAKAVFDNVAHTGHLDAPFIRHLISPLSIFNGDVLLTAQSPSGELYVLLGDFTGHGLTAAIGAMPLAEVFYGMTRKGFSAGEILREANRKLLSILPQGYFCCATLVSLDFQRGSAAFWNGGLPPGCLIRQDGELVHLQSRHLPLGIQSDERFDPTTEVLEMAVGDRLLLCTDGLIEARNDAEEAFGFQRFDDIVQRTGAGDSIFDALQQAVSCHIGSSGRDDDITLLEVTMVAPEQLPALPLPAPDGDSGAEEWRLCYELGPRSLREGNPLPLLQHILLQSPQLRSRASAVYTVLAELYSNALEHGLLGLDSGMKSCARGFARYYAARERALAALSGWVRFDLRCELCGDAGALQVTVTDSGPGFDHRRRLAEADSAGPAMRSAVADVDRRYHGRGIRLLRNLCDSVVYRGRGNEVEVTFAWSNGDA